VRYATAWVAAGGGATADLRYSNAATFDKYADIILEGKYQGMGMPSLKRWLTADDVDAIRAYGIEAKSGAFRDAVKRDPPLRREDIKIHKGLRDSLRL